MEVNKKLIQKTLTFIRNNYENFDQTYWDELRSGTRLRCFLGWALYLSGSDTNPICGAPRFELLSEVLGIDIETIKYLYADITDRWEVLRIAQAYIEGKFTYDTTPDELEGFLSSFDPCATINTNLAPIKVEAYNYPIYITGDGNTINVPQTCSVTIQFEHTIEQYQVAQADADALIQWWSHGTSERHALKHSSGHALLQFKVIETISVGLPS